MKLVLLRHGESIWNKENKFTGWTDVPLTKKGIEEAKKAGKLLKEKGYDFDIAYTSVLSRAIDTLKYVLENFDNVKIKQSWRLNERHYGALQGLNKTIIKEKYGERQLQLWRRSFDVRPPKLNKDDDRYPGNDKKYQGLGKDLPLTENLADTLERVKIYYESDIKKDLLKQKRVIIVAHGNSLRALAMYLEKMTKNEIMNFEIPTGVPYVYELDEKLNIKNKFFLTK